MSGFDAYIARTTTAWVGHHGHVAPIRTHDHGRGAFVNIQIDADGARFLADAIDNWCGPTDGARRDALQLRDLADLIDPPEDDT